MSRTSCIGDLIRDYTGTFVEIGTDRGNFAQFLLEHNCSKLYCIDPYSRYVDYTDSINSVTGNDLFEYAKKRLAPFGSRVEFIRNFSTKAAEQVPDELDMVYIDGNHAYSYVLADLTAWYPKIRKGGILIGDDVVDLDETKRGKDNNIFIEWSPGCYGTYGVYKALQDFCSTNGLTYTITNNQFVIRK